MLPSSPLGTSVSRWLWCLFAALTLCGGASAQRGLTFCCEEDNDLFQVVSKALPSVERFENPAEAVAAAPVGSGVLILADAYPATTTQLGQSLFELAAKKELRLFVEYPSWLPGVEIGKPVATSVERAVIASSFFGDDLKALRIVSINGLKYLPLEIEQPHIVAARVAGFDEAVFGLPDQTRPLLAELPEHEVLVATTSLSRFVTGRYAPQEAWHEIWSAILTWLDPSQAVALTWTPVVRASYGPKEALPEDFEREALRRGLEWYRRSKMIVPASFEELVANGDRLRSLPDGVPEGDGSHGSLEAVLSIIHEDGTQTIGSVRRGDCICETAMAKAFEAQLFDSPTAAKTASNLLDYYLFTSDARKRERGDPSNGNYGLIAWGVSTPAWWIASYGDDNARQIMGTLAVAALNGEDRWDEAIMQCLLANLRTTGKLGFRGDRIDVAQLNARGWESYFQASPVSYAPHFEAYLWACYLWAYGQTGDELFLDRAKTAIKMTMEQHTDSWRWTNGLAQERARIILPLAWLVRAEDTPEHRAMLRTAVDGLLSLQQENGAIREELGLPGKGVFPPPQSNAAYGTNEASLIARDGDPVSDLLYTTNFAFLGLHEAAAATGDADIIEAQRKLAEFLCRIQVRSERIPMVDGGWFRAFDYGRWEHWGSNADHGWGAWSIESGWTQGWITSVLAMRQMETSLWDLTQKSTIERHHARLREEMIPDRVYVTPDPIAHEARAKLITYQSAPSPNYPDNTSDLTNGMLGNTDYLNAEWVGWHGEDAIFTVDLGKTTTISQLDVSCLRALDVGIHLPRKVTYSVSSDGEKFDPVAVVALPADETRGTDGVHRFATSELKVEGRYVRVEAESVRTIPENFRAAGLAAWVFADEFFVNAN